MSSKIYLVGAELFHVGGQADGQIWQSSYSLLKNFVNAPKTEYLSHIKHTVSPFQVLQFNVI
jgi:hypothetical protein